MFRRVRPWCSRMAPTPEPAASRPDEATGWRHAAAGLGDSEKMTVGLGVLLVVAFGPFFYSFGWTPRVVLLLAALPFGLYSLGELARGRDRSALAAVCLISWALIIGLTADAPIVSVLGAIGRWDSVVFLASGLGCWALGRQLSDRGRLALGVAFVAACAVNGLVAVLQVVFDPSYEPLAISGGRASGLSVNPVYFGATMAGAAGYGAWHCAVVRPGRQLQLALLVFGIAVFMVSLSGSRIALASCVVLIVGAVGVTRGAIRTLLLVPVAVVGSALATILQRSVGEASGAATNRLTTSGTWPRSRIWSYGWNAFVERPITGYGLGRFRPAVQRFFSPEFVRREAFDDLTQAWYDPHSIVVQVAVTLGIVGVALSVFFVASTGRKCRGPLVWAAVGISLSWLLQPTTHVTFALAALLLGASHLEREVAAPRRARASARRAITAIACVIALLLAGWAVVADLQLARADEAGELSASRRAAAWNRLDARALLTASTAIFNPVVRTEEIDSEVLEWTERATEIEPGLPIFWAQLGIRQLLLGEGDSAARESLEHALELQPYHPLSLVVLQTIAERQGDEPLLATVTRRLDELEAAVDDPGS